MNKARTKTQAENIADILKRRIDKEYPPGSRFLSNRQIANEYGVSILTAQKIVGVLGGMGLLKVIPKSGAYVKGRDAGRGNSERRTVLFVFTDLRPFGYDALHFGVFAAIEKELNKRNFDLQFKTCGSRPLELNGSRDRLGGFIISSTMTSDANHSKIVRGLVGTGLPCAAYHYVYDGMDSVVSDYYEETHGAVRHLCSLGHRNILFVRDYKESWRHREWVEGYVAAMEEAGATPDLSSDWNIFEPGKLLAFLLEGVKSRNPLRPTALVIPNSIVCMEIMKEIMDAGVRIPEELSFVSTDRRAGASPLRPTTMACDPDQMGRETARTLVKRMESGNQKPPVTKVLPVSLLDSGTCKKVGMEI